MLHAIHMRKTAPQKEPAINSDLAAIIDGESTLGIFRHARAMGMDDTETVKALARAIEGGATEINGIWAYRA